MNVALRGAARLGAAKVDHVLGRQRRAGSGSEHRTNARRCARRHAGRLVRARIRRLGTRGGGGGGRGSSAVAARRGALRGRVARVRARGLRVLRELLDHHVLSAFDFGAAERTQVVRALAALQPLRQARRTQEMAAGLDLHVLHTRVI